MAIKGVKQNKTSLDIRLKALNEKINEGRSYSFLAKKYEVSSKTVETWVRIYRRDGVVTSTKK